MRMFDLQHKHILVTGASSGIGRACAIMASELGASVVLTGRRKEALEETKQAMASPGEHSVVVGDISLPDFVRRLADEAGRLDGLVHAAGVCPAIPVGMINSSVLLDSVTTNYFAFMELMRYYANLKVG